ncbi:MAG TPA: ExbD/TolR family protein [Vicinamibacterales bacterium]|nr:ExbD/TolR family protein [Vicinamibacterales bacterium]
MPKLAPSAGASSARSGRNRRVATSLAEINVVPLVDVMLVLLIIFMVTAPMLQRGIDVKLPQSRRAAQVTGERIEITVPASFAQQQTLYIGKESIPARAFQERIRQQIEHRDNKEVFLRGDGTVTYQDLMQVIDMLKGAGVTNIGMVARMPGER